VPTTPRQPLRIETQQDDRLVVLGCESCDETVELRTSDPLFAVSVQAFFEKHARCAGSSIDLP
jgi:hypothetical protein